MSTLTQAPTGAVIKQQAKALKGATAVKAPAETAAWYGRFNEAITKAKGDFGAPLTADEALAGCLIGGAAGKPKRPGVEALWLGLTLRAAGGNKHKFNALKM